MEMIGLDLLTVWAGCRNGAITAIDGWADLQLTDGIWQASKVSRDLLARLLN